MRGIKRKALFENEQMPCVRPEGVEYFCDREAEGSECQRHSQLCSRKKKKNCMKVKKKKRKNRQTVGGGVRGRRF